MCALTDHACVSAQYGKQFVPVSADDEAYLAYQPERGLHLLGFLPADDVPQHQFLKVRPPALTQVIAVGLVCCCGHA